MGTTKSAGGVHVKSNGYERFPPSGWIDYNECQHRIADQCWNCYYLTRANFFYRVFMILSKIPMCQ